jgi:hypothetical protein
MSLKLGDQDANEALYFVEELNEELTKKFNT